MFGTQARACIVLVVLLFIRVDFISAQATATDIQQKNQTLGIKTNNYHTILKMLEQGKLQAAEKWINAHLKNNPIDSDYLLLQARLMHRLGNHASAIQTLKYARQLAPDYEDIYLTEAAILASLGVSHCDDMVSLFENYQENTQGLQLGQLERIRFDGRYGVNEIMVQSQYDKLTNNRGIWRSYTIQYRKKLCSMNSFYAGVNHVQRYDIEDGAGIVGGNVKFSAGNIELEYRQSQDRGILARNIVSGMLTLETGTYFNVLLTSSYREYRGLDTESIGLGMDVYFGDFLLSIIGERTHYYTENTDLDSSTIGKFYLGYYVTPRKYIRFGYVSGKELDNDGSESPPYSKIRTGLLTVSLPVARRSSIVVEAKRHYQTGYYRQNGIRVAYSYQY